MFRGLLRALFGRVGRTLLILFALGAAWGLWWVWPERPVREIAIDRTPDIETLEYATISPSGRMVLLSTAPAYGDNVEMWHSRVVCLDDGSDVLDPKMIGHDKVVFDGFDEYVLLMSPEKKLRAYRTQYRQFENVSDHISHQFSAKYCMDDYGFGWNACHQEFITDKTSWISDLASRLFPTQPWFSNSFLITHEHDRFPPRVIRGAFWCGFTWNDRGWTQNWRDEEKIILREWDLRPPKTPWWLWLTTGALSVVVVVPWFRASRVRQNPVAETPRN